MSTAIDVAAFERLLPDSEALRTRADVLQSTGATVASVAESAAGVWGRLQGGIYTAPGQDIVFSAFTPITTCANEIAEAMGEVRTAVVAYADATADIRARFDSQVRPAAEAFAADTAGQLPAEWDDDRDLVERQNTIMSQLSALAADLDAAQQACAGALARTSSGVGPGTGSVEDRDPFGFGRALGQGAGFSASGAAAPITAAQFDAAAASPSGVAWGWAVEHDDGTSPFERGIRDQVIGTFEGLTGVAGWRGPAAQQEIFQGMFFTLGSLIGKNAAAEQNQRDIVRQAAHVDLFKTQPARAAGRLTFDVGTMLIPVGAVAKAGTFGRVAARVGSVDVPAPRLEVTTPPAPGLRGIGEARPGLLNQLRTWVQENAGKPQPAYPAGTGTPGSKHRFDVVHNEAANTGPDNTPGPGAPGPGPGSTPDAGSAPEAARTSPDGGPRYGVQLPDYVNPAGPGRNPELQPVLGDSEHGPGQWGPEHSSPHGRAYQEYVTGVQLVDGKMPEYVLKYDKVDPITGVMKHPEVKIDGFYWDKGPPPVQVYVEAKGYYVWMKGTSFYDRVWSKTFNEQFTNQIDALRQSGGNTRLEWHFQDQEVADDFLERVLDDPDTRDLVDEGKLVIKWTPMP